MLVDCDQHGDKEMEFEREIRARRILLEWRIASWDVRLVFYDLRDFPYLHPRSGVSSRGMRNAVKGYTESSLEARHFYIMCEEERKKVLPWTRRMGVWGSARPPVPRARDLGDG